MLLCAVPLSAVPPPMTEYDYSPEAYERYVSRQQAIARWVDDTSLYTPANPFVPLPGASPPTAYRPQDRGPDVNFERSSSSRPLGYSYGKDDGHRSRPGRHDRHRSRKQSAPTPATYNYSSQPAYGYGVQQQVPYGQGQYHYRSTSAQYNSPYDSSSRTPTASPPPRSASKSQPNQPIVIAIKGGNTGHFPGRQKGASYQVVSHFNLSLFFSSTLLSIRSTHNQYQLHSLGTSECSHQRRIQMAERTRYLKPLAIVMDEVPSRAGVWISTEK